MTQKPLGFLDLPPEIRLRIYGILLISRENHYAYAPSTKTWYRGTSFDKHIIRMTGSRSGNGHGSLAIDTPEPYGWKWEYQTPSPAILLTCQTIAREAAPLLYRDNDFLFFCEGSDDLEDIVLEYDLPNLCRDIFDHTPEDRLKWDDVSALLSLDFASFLNMTGRTNASLLKSLTINAPDADKMAGCLPTITELVVNHLPNLRHLKIHVQEVRVPYDESPEYWHPNHLSPFWHNGQFWPLYRGLNNFVDRVHWLREFEYGGQEDFAERESWELLYALKKTVKERRQA